MIYTLGNPNPEFERLGRAFVGFGSLGQRLRRIVSNGTSCSVVFDDTATTTTDDLQQMPFAEYRATAFADRWFIVGLGYKHLRLRLEVVQTLQAADRFIYSIVHRDSGIDSSAAIGAGAFVNTRACVADGASIGDGVVLEANATVAHDSLVGPGSFVGPGAVLCGNVRVGSCVFIGAGAVVRNGIIIGDNATIGMGAVITRDIGESESWIGNPSRLAHSGIRLT